MDAKTLLFDIKKSAYVAGWEAACARHEWKFMEHVAQEYADKFLGARPESPGKLRHITVYFENNIRKPQRIQYDPEKKSFQFQSGSVVKFLHHLTSDSLIAAAQLKENPYGS